METCRQAKSMVRGVQAIPTAPYPDAQDLQVVAAIVQALHDASHASHEEEAL